MKLKGLSLQEQNEMLPDNLVFLGYRGSISHGTYRPSSDPNSVDDKDLIGVFWADPEHYLGFGRKETIEKKFREWDCVFYEYRKFVSLLAKGNPNVLGTLWLDSKHQILTTEDWTHLVESRDLFVAKHAYRSFTGYAYSQLKRMTHLACEGYMGEKRKRLVQEHGYDTKNASHLIRLLRMGIEFLTEGQMFVERHDATQLLDIKDGCWSLDKVQSEAEKLFDEARSAYERSTLPSKPDRGKVEGMLVERTIKHLAETWQERIEL